MRPPYILDTLEPDAVIRAIEESQFFLWNVLSAWPRMKVHNDPNLLWSITNIKFPLFNSVMRARLTEREVQPTIDRMIDTYRRAEVPMLWWVGPSTKPANLESTLGHNGFIKYVSTTGMAIRLSDFKAPVSSNGYRTQLVVDLDDLQRFNSVASQSFGMPDEAAEGFLEGLACTLLKKTEMPLHQFVCYKQGKPVSCASLLLEAGVAGIYNVATIPEARGLGAATALMWATITYARSRGYKVSILHASEMGEPLYLKLGYNPFCQIKQYVLLEAG